MEEVREETYPTGGLTEFDEWHIHVNYKTRYVENRKRCPHTTEEPETPAFPSARVNPGAIQWSTPRVVVAANEGGYNITAVCLDCILERGK